MERGVCIAVCRYESIGKVHGWSILFVYLKLLLFKLLPRISVHHVSLNNHHVIIVPSSVSQKYHTCKSISRVSHLIPVPQICFWTVSDPASVPGGAVPHLATMSYIH